MTAVLLVLVLAQPPGGAATRAAVERDLARRLNEASKLVEDPEGAIRLLTALLGDARGRDIETVSPFAPAYRDQALYLRAELFLEQGQAQRAADDLTAVIRRKEGRLAARTAALLGALAAPLPHVPLTVAVSLLPAQPLNRVDCLGAFTTRVQAWNALGQQDREQADRATVTAIFRELTWGMNLPPQEYQPPNRPPAWYRLLTGAPRGRFSPWTGRLLVPCVFVGMGPVFFLLGMRQRRDARGSWRRLFRVALALAFLQAVPVLAAVLLVAWRPRFFARTALPYVTFVVFVFNVYRYRNYLRAVTWQGTRAAPPLLEDTSVLARIEQIAARMGLVAPVARLVRSASAQQTNNALITGLAAPTLVLFDGILYRLSEEERDAIIAHELAHLANRTFWHWLLADAFCAVAVVVAAAFYPVLVVMALGVTLLTGTRIVLSRRLELDCDRRAARAIGHRRAASALWKIHADQGFPRLVEFLMGAIGTHPSRDERLAAIHRDAPAGDRPDVDWNPRLLARRHLAAWLAGGLWLVVIAGCLLWGRLDPGSLGPALPLFLMELSLVVLSWLALRKKARRRSRLLRTRRTWGTWLGWLVPGLLVAYLVAHSFGLTEPYLGQMASLGILAGGVLACLVLAGVGRAGRARALNLQVAIAIQSNDYPRALAICEGKPAVVAGSAALRYNHALIRAVLGRRGEALADLERLRQDEPDFKMTWLLLASLYADEGEYARALELAVQLSRDLPGEVSAAQTEAWLLRKLGRLEEAEAQARAVLAKEPEAGQGLLTLAGVALDRGDHAAARALLARAERSVPGTVGTALLAAELALATDDPGAAAAVARAIEVARNNPLAFADKEAASLARRLEARSGSLQSMG